MDDLRTTRNVSKGRVFRQDFMPAVLLALAVLVEMVALEALALGGVALEEVEALAAISAVSVGRAL